MRKRCIRMLLVIPAIFAMSAAGETHSMPANPERIGDALVRKGAVAANATGEERERAVDRYLKTKVGEASVGKTYSLARKRVDAARAGLASSAAAIKGRKLGQSTATTPSTPMFKPAESEGKLVVVLVEFSDSPVSWTPTGQAPRTASGPMHNKLPVPTNDFDLYVPDFNAKHYESMMFTPGGWTFPQGVPFYAGQRRPSMRDMYTQMSHGRYTVGGQVHGWFRVDNPEAFYGDDAPNGGTDNQLPGTPRHLIADAVAKVNAAGAIKWEDYDTNGDCVIDHPLFVHAGADQSGGGGAQGDDAIWAHRSTGVNVKVADKAGCGPAGLHIDNYTIMPEDGGIGVFAHEFGHDLGLPDEYDTIYSGRGESVQYWSLMSAGSWLGKPAQTQPPFMSPWARTILGWLRFGDNLGFTTLDDFKGGATPVRLEQAERWGGPGTMNGLFVLLPEQIQRINTPHSGSYEWYAENADLKDVTLRRAVDLTGKSSASLSFWTWYDIEPGWDFAFLQVSNDGGATWKSMAVPGSTSTHDPDAMPTIVNELPGLTGNSGGWVQKTVSLSQYAGQNILVQFRHMTDWGTTLNGIFIDDVTITANGAVLLSDNVETAAAGWTANGWSRSTGSFPFPHYYFLEWRNTSEMTTPYGNITLVNGDAGLKNAYQGDAYAPAGSGPRYYPYAPGLVLWYANTRFTDNWTGIHPGYGFLLVVDAHKQGLQRPPVPGFGAYPWGTHVQSYDAAFNTLQVPDLNLQWAGMLRRDPGLNAVPNFDDSQTYWSNVAPHASAITPKYGLSFRVLGAAPDASAVIVGLGQK